MKINIEGQKNINLNTNNTFVLFTDNESKIFGLDLLPLRKSSKLINNTIKIYKKENQEFIQLNFNETQKIILIKIKHKLDPLGVERLGAKFYDYIKSDLSKSLIFFNQNIVSNKYKTANFSEEFFHGLRLKSFVFSKYKNNKKNTKLEIKLIGKTTQTEKNKTKRFNSIIDGTNLTKELVSEPGNILHPDEYAKRILQLRKIGLKVTIYDKKKLKKLGMNALLGVGQGSIRGSYLVTIEWKGDKLNKKPLAFVGKGVCFDTGGISLKPAKFMEDMTYDMAGSAVVVGLMKTLALRKAKINAVGVVGLVENMPDGNAQRPGDIVKSYSGKTIEILNTDAEGRLVLADALTFTEKKYNPKFIVDLATLTGAIIVSLGSEYAGMFSNNDKLSKELYEAGKKVGEKVWRMPLHKNYDKLIDSKNADMQNINYVGGAGSTTAAQFLQRFILKNTPWAHLDIAGMAFSKYGGALNSWGATGFGVRLLNKLIEDNYE